MAVIFKKIKRLRPRGFLLISSLVIVNILVVIVSFYLNAIIQEVRVENITNRSSQTYYLAEAGLQEALWKLQNEIDWQNSFITNPAWQATFTRRDQLLAGGAYAVTVANQGLAQAVITATSTLTRGQTTSQRVVKTNVFRPLNEFPTDNIAIFTNGDLQSVGALFNIVGGDIFANDEIELNSGSVWNVEAAAKAVESVEVDASSSLSAAAINDEDRPPVPAAILMPQIDFDSADLGSYKSRANQIYTAGQFAQLLADSPNLSLSGITYVTGNIHVKKGHNVTVNGLLVADGNVTVGNGFSPKPTPATLTVNQISPNPSGLLAKGNITIGGFASAVTVNGLIYGGGNFRIQDSEAQDVDVTVVGGIMAQSMDSYTIWDPNTITLNQIYINQALGSQLYSPVLVTNYWEEQY